MRKITSLLVLFLCCVGMAWAQDITSGKPYYLKVKDTNLYIDIKNGKSDTSGPTISISSSPVAAYFTKSGSGWMISVDPETNYLKVSNWCANPNQETGSIWTISESENAYVLSQDQYKGNGEDARVYLGNDSGANTADAKLYTDQYIENAVKFTLVEAPMPITDLSQLSNGKLYAIAPKAAAQRGVLYATSTSTCLDACGAGGNHNDIAVDPTSPDQQFAIYTHDEKIYLYSVGAGKFAAGIINDRYFALSEEPTHNYTIVESTESGYFIIKLDDNNYINVSTGWTAGCVGAYAKEDDGNRLIISAVADMPEDLSTKLENKFDTQREFTYTFKYNGEVKYTQNCTGNVGEVYPDVDASLFPYGVTATKPEGNIPSDVASNIDVVLTVGELPFEATEDVNAINKWYFMQIHSNNKKYIEYIADGNYMEWTDAEVNTVNRDAYMWAFVGNIWDGFKLVNKAATAANAIKSVGSGNPGMDTFANGTSFVLKKGKVADGNGFVYFCLQYPDGDYLNAQSGKVAHWWDTDAGSAINLFEALTLDAELATLVDEIEAKNYDSYVGETVGCLTAESVAALKEAIANAKNVQDADIDDLVTLQNAVEALEIILPQEGRFYTIESAIYENDYIYAGTNNKVYHNTDRTNASSEAIWQFVKNDDGSFRLYSVSNNQYISRLGWQEPSTLGNSSEMKFTFEPQGNGVVFIKGNGNEMHAQLANRALVYYNTNTLNSASSWIVKEVTNFTQKVNVSSVGYSTLVLGYNAEIPADVEAYTVSNIGSDYVTLSEVTGVLPAGEAVVLIAPEAEYSFNYSTGTLATISENLLEGTLFDTYIEGAQNTNYYVLSKPAESEVGLYKAALNKDATGAAGTTHFKNNAFKAYLPLTTSIGVNALRFNFDGETTAIETVETENTNAPIYDLSGRRVLSTVKGGVYIQNGKKFIVK